MGREEHLKHPVRAVAAAVSQARIGYGTWRICIGDREIREFRLCLHCSMRVVESVTHSLSVSPLNNDLRSDMVTKLWARLSAGLQLQLELPEENGSPRTPTYGRKYTASGTPPEELGDDIRMSFRALSAAARADIGADASLTPCRHPSLPALVRAAIVPPAVRRGLCRRCHRNHSIGSKEV